MLNRKENDVLYMVIPIYNEEANIKEVIESWYPVIAEHNGNGKSKLLLIDDGSKDKSLQIIRRYEKDYPLIKAMTKPNEGHGATVLYGYKYALEEGADYIFQTDSDGQTLPEEFETLWKYRKDYTMVIGHRNKRQDGLSRIMVTKTLKATLKICFGVSIIDANTPYRIIKATSLRENLHLVPEKFNLSNVVISVIFARRKYPVKYIPITFKPRQGGVNSINLKKIVRIGLQAVKDFIQINSSLNNMN